MNQSTSHSKQWIISQGFTKQLQHKSTHLKFSKLLTAEPNENNFLHRTSSETENTEVIRSNSKIPHELRRIHSTNQQPELLWSLCQRKHTRNKNHISTHHESKELKYWWIINYRLIGIKNSSNESERKEASEQRLVS